MKFSLKSHPEILLYEHLKRVGGRMGEIVGKKDLYLTVLTKENLILLSKVIGYCHDFGKATSFFQKYINGGKIDFNINYKNHALISGFFCYELLSQISVFKNTIFPYVGAFICKKHHGDLDTLNQLFELDLEKKEQLNVQLKSLKNNAEIREIYLNLLEELNLSIDFDIGFSNIQEKVNATITLSMQEKLLINKNLNLEFFLLIELLNSLLIDSDKKHASGILNENFNLNIDLDENLVERYIETQRKINSKKFDSSLGINKLKDLFFEQCTNNLSLCVENHIYLIKAPTGIGKTLTSFATALKLRKKLCNDYKIHYILPFTTVIEQNYSVFCEVLKCGINDFEDRENDYILKHHYLAEYDYLKKINEENISYSSDSYSKNLLFVNSWDSSIVVSTYVQLLHTIIGGKNSFMNKFHNVVNSIIVLDEVQAIPTRYWDLVRELFIELSTKFGVYFIFLSATIPLIFDGKKDKIIELTKSKYLFLDSEMNRVEIENNLGRVCLDNLYKNFIHSYSSNPVNRYLFILNTKKSSLDFYLKVVKEKKRFNEYIIVYLSTNLTSFDRKKNLSKIIGDSVSKIQSEKKYIVITTQLIEAGVDISSDICYRDFAPADSIIQSIGRCNRFNELKEIGKKGKFILFTLINENNEKLKSFGEYIYDKEFLEKTYELIPNLKDSSNILEFIDKYYLKMVGLRHSNELSKNIVNSNFSAILDSEKGFKVINSYPTIEIFILNAESKFFLEEYKKILNSKEEKFIKNSNLKKIRKKLSLFMIDILPKKFDELEHHFEKIGDFFYYLDVKKYPELYNSETGFNLNYDAFQF